MKTLESEDMEIIYKVKNLQDKFYVKLVSDKGDKLKVARGFFAFDGKYLSVGEKVKITTVVTHINHRF